MQKLEGTAMTELVEGGRLKRADILLTRSKGSVWGWLIRRITHCYWNHALIVYAVRDPDQGYDKTLIIDPRMGGINMENIAHYFQTPNQYDMAVRRLDREWFQNDSEEGGLPYRQMVCDISLRETDDEYDTLPRRTLKRVVRYVTLAYRFLFWRGRRRKHSQTRISPIATRLKINSYSCSGFVQWSYYQGVSRVLHDREDKTRLQEVIFNPKITGEVSDYDLLSTTPADLANNDKLSWKYAVKDGVVWEVSSEDEVSSILNSAKSLK